MLTVSVTLGALVDRTLLEMEDPAERGRQVVLNGALTASGTSIVLVDATGVSVSNLLEFGSELVLVTAKSSDVIPTFTISRGYYGTTPAARADQSVGTQNPQFPRVRVAEAIKRSFARLEALGLPLVKTATFNKDAVYQHVGMPTDVRSVLRVAYVNTYTGRWDELGGWEFIDDVPTTLSITGKIVRVASNVVVTDDLEITYRVPYRWSTHPTAPSETSTVTLYEGGEDLPAVYAAAWLMGAREISRSKVDRSSEWNESEPIRNGGSTTLLRLRWQNFYQMLGEVQKLVPSMPIHRPFKKMPKVR